MARIRSTKPEFWLDPKTTRMSRDARMLYMALWNLADEHARLLGDARVIKGQTFPYDDDLTPAVIDDLIDEMVHEKKAIRYVVEEAVYLHLPNLHKHQRLEPGKVESRLPAPPSESRANESARRAEESALLQGAGSMEQVAGGGCAAPVADLAQTDPEPPPRCRRHMNTNEPPACGPCGDYRRNHDRWLRAEKAKPTPIAGPGSRVRCKKPDHEHEIAASCRLCRSEAIAQEDAS